VQSLWDQTTTAAVGSISNGTTSAGGNGSFSGGGSGVPTPYTGAASKQSTPSVLALFAAVLAVVGLL